MAKTQPQVLVVSNPSNFQSVQLANLNTAIPMNNGLGTLNVTDTPAQKRRKMEEFHSISGELKERQKNIDKKLERLIEVVEESNKIQKDRNRLLQEYLSKIN
ncbi:hypothetical protein NQ317_002442 [Molorchus minor]|uniref:Uncharacterized protein n=1 Tax=Molorchus minor TaxID=1323400 RepID=A0ABQ9J768_9CUCU|nr:hypothetical protein NQ317_002442 [Molorchus minor]